MNGILKRIATFFVALLSLFLLGEVFLTLRGEIIQVVVIAIIVVTTIGWDFLINFIGNLLAVSGEIVAVQMRNLREFLSAHWKKIAGMGAYQIIGWAYDNPIWMALVLFSPIWGTAMAIAIAFIINAVNLFIHRRNKAAWTGLEDFEKFLQSREDGLSEMFFLMTSERALIVFYLTAILSPDPIRSLQLVFVFFIYFEIAILISRKRGDAIAFFLLSFWQDAFITTVYLRHGKCENGLRSKDYLIFVLSSITSIVYWTIRNGLIVELVLRPMLKV
jgi:hypothetical protein